MQMELLPEADCFITSTTSLNGRKSIAGLDSSCGKTSLEPLAQARAQTLQAWLASWQDSTTWRHPKTAGGGEGVALGGNGLLEWCTLDAQYFGVAQRRRRVFALLDAGDWKNRPPVLLERQSVRGDTAPSRSAGQEIAKCLTAGIGTRLDGETDTFIAQVYENHAADSRIKSVEISPTVTSRWGTGGGNVPIALAENIIGRQPHNGGNGDGFTEGGPMYTLNATGVHGVAHPVVLMDQGGSVMNVLEDGAVGTLRRETHGHEPCIVAAFKGGQGSSAGGIGYDEHTSPTLTSAESGSNRTPALLHGMAVRRLTPIECERLQGFPDGYTDIPYISYQAAQKRAIKKGISLSEELESMGHIPMKVGDKSTPDGSRYKALGNSMAVPVMQWIGKQIQKASE